MTDSDLDNIKQLLELYHNGGICAALTRKVLTEMIKNMTAEDLIKIFGEAVKSPELV